MKLWPAVLLSLTICSPAYSDPPPPPPTNLLADLGGGWEKARRGPTITEPGYFLTGDALRALIVKVEAEAKLDALKVEHSLRVELEKAQAEADALKLQLESTAKLHGAAEAGWVQCREAYKRIGAAVTPWWKSAPAAAAVGCLACGGAAVGGTAVVR